MIRRKESIPLASRLLLSREPTIDRLIGRRLTVIREAARLTQEELETLSGLPASCLHEHESGEVPLPMSRVRPIAAVLDLHPMELFLRLLFPSC